MKPAKQAARNDDRRDPETDNGAVPIAPPSGKSLTPQETEEFVVRMTALLTAR